MYKVIFVDDEPLILEGLKQIIEWDDYGINVVGTATNPEDARVLIKEFNPEIIITDIRMQGANGLDMIEDLNKNGYKGYIIILSGHRDFEYAQKAIENRVYSYLLKPLDINKLKELISRIIAELGETNVNTEDSKSAIEEVVEYIKIHFLEDISLTELAKQYHFELSNFSRMFKRCTGENYTDYVSKMRVEHAKWYLSDTTRTIEEISETVGYKSARYFRDLFMEYTGQTPSQYRKEKRQNRNEKKQEQANEE